MTTYKASARNLKASVKKMRPIIDIIRYRTIDDACAILEHSNRRAGRRLMKVLAGVDDSIRSTYQVRQTLDYC